MHGVSMTAEIREIAPTEPDSNGIRWRRYETTGRVFVVPTCEGV